MADVFGTDASLGISGKPGLHVAVQSLVIAFLREIDLSEVDIQIAKPLLVAQAFLSGENSHPRGAFFQVHLGQVPAGGNIFRFHQNTVFHLVE